jgi:protein arginine N-methyltransferase 1
MSLVVDEHRTYLEDEHRLAAFRRAIEHRVRPGSIVLDLASGTGILGLMACRAGAARVYSIESGGMVEVARQVAQANGFADRVVFIKQFSTQASLPEPVDVVVADQVGNFGFNAGILEYFADARKRFLKPGGATIPSGIGLFLCPVEAPALFAQVDFWATSPGGFDFGSTRVLAANTGYQVEFPGTGFLAQPAQVAFLDLGDASLRPIHGTAAFRASRSAMLHGIGGWFIAELAPGVTMTNSPLAADRIRRRQIFFPIERPVEVAEGDEIGVEMAIRPADGLVNWTVEVGDGSTGDRKGRFRHSTWKGMLLNREDLARTRPEFVPRLTARGEARRTVVDLCDGARTVGQIESELMSRHPGLFASREEAATFVAEVVTRYAE